MNKNILLICHDNAALSIMAEAILNRYLKGVDAQSCAYKKAKGINPAVKKALIKDGSWSDEYHAKTLDQLSNKNFDLVIILSANAAKAADAFDETTVVIEIEYEEPDYSNTTNTERFLKTIKMELIPISRDILEL